MLNIKKAQLEYGGYIVWIFFLVLAAVAMFFLLNSTFVAKSSVETSAPELIYKFPAVFVHTFLMTQISEDDTKKFFPETKQTHFVKDLIYINTDESKEAVSKYRNDFLESINIPDSNGYTILDLYARYTDRTYFDRLLLRIEYDVDSLPIPSSNYDPDEGEDINIWTANVKDLFMYSIDNIFEDINAPDEFSIHNNYFFHLKTKSDNYAMIFFEDPVGYEIEKAELDPKNYNN